MLIRDVIHDDMEFNEYESSIIQTGAFQRLHGIRHPFTVTAPKPGTKNLDGSG